MYGSRRRCVLATSSRSSSIDAKAWSRTRRCQARALLSQHLAPLCLRYHRHLRHGLCGQRDQHITGGEAVLGGAAGCGAQRRGCGLGTACRVRQHTVECALRFIIRLFRMPSGALCHEVGMGWCQSSRRDREPGTRCCGMHHLRLLLCPQLPSHTVNAMDEVRFAGAMERMPTAGFLRWLAREYKACGGGGMGGSMLVLSGGLLWALRYVNMPVASSRSLQAVLQQMTNRWGWPHHYCTRTERSWWLGAGLRGRPVPGRGAPGPAYT